VAAIVIALVAGMALSKETSAVTNTPEMKSA
jgi:hypothetical protein